MPGLGRYSRLDPILLNKHICMHSFSLFNQFSFYYGNNNSFKYIDISGLIPNCWGGGGGGFAAAGGGVSLSYEYNCCNNGCLTTCCWIQTKCWCLGAGVSVGTYISSGIGSNNTTSNFCIAMGGVGEWGGGGTLDSNSAFLGAGPSTPLWGAYCCCESTPLTCN
jgi:hypothetical protein